jgi:uncharacterized protein (UPF0212 family)
MSKMIVTTLCENCNKLVTTQIDYENKEGKWIVGYATCPLCHKKIKAYYIASSNRDKK